MNEPDGEPYFCGVCDYESMSEQAVWGHIGAKHRKGLKPIRHGSTNGYQAERRRGMPTCPACRAAWSAYYRAKRGNQVRGIKAIEKWLAVQGRKL